MKTTRFPHVLLPAVLLLGATAQAQTLSAIVTPPPEAPAVTQAAQGLLDAVNARVPQLDTAGLIAQLKAQPQTVVIDVRTPAELNLSGYVDAPRFFNLARGQLEFQIEAAVPDKATPIVVYCGVSQRSPLAADTLIKLGYTNRGFEDLTLRMSFENGRRRGSEYEFWPVEDMGTGLPGLDWDTIVSQYLKTAAAAPGWTVAPASLSGYLARYAYDSRKYDQADRNQQVSNLRANFAAREDLDLGVSLQYRNVSYPSSDYGLAVDRGTSVNLDATYQPSLAQLLSAREVVVFCGSGGSTSVRLEYLPPLTRIACPSGPIHHS